MTDAIETSDLTRRFVRARGRRLVPRRAVVGACRGIATTRRVGKRRELDRAGEPAVADLLVLAVPASVGRDPHLELDVRLGARLHRTCNATKADGRLGAADDGVSDVIRLRKRDRRIGQRDIRHVVARHGGCRRGMADRRCDRERKRLRNAAATKPARD